MTRTFLSRVIVSWAVAGSAYGFGVVGEDDNQVAVRWDAAPRTIAGNERSLDGGLRYSLSGGSYEAYRDMFDWAANEPTVSDFATAVQDAFTAWTAVDPVSGLGTSIYFVDDTTMTVAASGTSIGAEIDLLAGSSADEGVFGASASIGWTIFTTDVVTLTTGDVRGKEVLSGSDITMNNDNVPWTLNLFQDVLTHEIGHALGLADVEVAGSLGAYIDDNFDGTSSSLLNSFAARIDPIHPEASSGLNRYNVPTALFDADNGITGAPFLLMESDGDPGAPSPAALGNDAFAGRQYLYPVAIPEPGPWMLMGLIATGMFSKRFIHRRVTKTRQSERAGAPLRVR